ncbi:MAG: hypothetical protein ACFFDN_15390 [Candidatus Hodarchaeota archaeon]
MIQEPLIFFGILIISLIMSSFFLSDRAGPFRPVAMRLFFIGVIFHEVSHYVMSLVVGRIPEGIRIKWRDEKYRYRSPHGAVKSGKPETFLQAIIISLAPLYISTWLIFFLWFGVVFNSAFNPVVRFIAGCICVSLFLTAAPSSGDIQMISKAFNEDPSHSWYQIFLIGISTFILWLFLTITHIIFFLDVFYYLAIAGIYLTLRFSFIGITRLIIKIQSRDFTRPSKVRFKQFSRKYYKPKKPWKEK